MALHRTLELHVDTGDGERVFEPLTVHWRADLSSVIRNMMQERGLTSVEVREFGEHLFTLKD